MVESRAPTSAESLSARSSASPLLPAAVGPQTTKAPPLTARPRGSRARTSAPAPRILDRARPAGRAADRLGDRFTDRFAGVEDVRARGLDADRHVLPGLGRRPKVHGVAAPGLADCLPVLV